MTVSTTQPALQLYSDNVTRPTTGKGGKAYGNHYSLSLETEAYLDAVNHPDFPSTEVRPGKPLHEVTVFRFGLPLRSSASVWRAEPPGTRWLKALAGQGLVRAGPRRD